VFAARIVEAVDVFEGRDLDFKMGLPVVVPDQFGFQRREEAFDSGLGPGCSVPASGRMGLEKNFLALRFKHFRCNRMT
jgi:hypothetical protein